MSDIELRQLRYFVTVAEELNFTRAAERLQIAQPPLSRQIQSLERSLGVDLLKRDNRRVELTPAGRVFLDASRQVLRQMEVGILATQRAAQGENGKLLVGFEGSSYNDLLLRMVQTFRANHPEVDLILQEMPSGKQLDALEKYQLDVGFIDPTIANPDVTLAVLQTEPLMVALNATHPLNQYEQLTLSQLADQPWITGRSDNGCGLRARIVEACRQAGFQPQVRQETNDIQMTLSSVAAGLGVTLLPASVRNRELPGIAVLPLQPPVPVSELAVTWLPNHESSILETFLETIKTNGQS